MEGEEESLRSNSVVVVEVEVGIGNCCSVFFYHSMKSPSQRQRRKIVNGRES